MSLITRCPHCATSFKVVTDQLRISDGWVRCGHCKEVFDATEHLLVQESEQLLPDMPLHDLKAPPAPAPREPSASVWSAAGDTPETVDVAPETAPTGATQQRSAEPLQDVSVVPTPAAGTVPLPAALSNWSAPVPAFLRVQPKPEPEPEPKAPESTGVLPRPSAEAGLAGMALPTGMAAAVEREADALAPHADSEDAYVHQEEEDAPLPTLHGHSHWPPRMHADIPGHSEEVPAGSKAPGTVAPAQPPRARKAQAEDQDEEDEEAAALAAELSFVKEARRSAFWRHPLTRAVLSLGVLCLLLSLGLQVALREHDTIAARHPQARVWMQKLCARMHCTVRAPRDIAALVIDSSSFLKARDGQSTYRLQFSVKNQASFAVATPALELSLTDAQDQVVLRRVLQPEELHAPVDLEPAAIWNTGATVQLVDVPNPVAGYRLLAFYP